MHRAERRIDIDFVILTEQKRVKVVSDEEYFEWRNNNKDLHIAEDIIDGIYISTVFLAMVFHTPLYDVYFETQIFDDREDRTLPFNNFPFAGSLQRYGNYRDAMAGHQQWVDKIKRWVATGINEDEE